MPILPPHSSDTTVSHIDNKETTDFPRGYMGFSQIGEPCLRKLQLTNYMTYTVTINSRTERIFRFGHIAEDFIIEDLKSVGVEVIREQEEIVGPYGHWKGHIDGVGVGLKESSKHHLLEFKTHNDRSFKDVVKKGVKASKPIHFSQMQIYMHYLKLPRALYIAYNKNDSSYYFERINYDKEHSLELVSKAKRVVTSYELQPRLSDSPSWFECRWCSAKDVCFGYEKPVKHCRNCEFGDMIDGGKWHCDKHDKILDEFTVCDSYQLKTILEIEDAS